MGKMIKLQKKKKQSQYSQYSSWKTVLPLSKAFLMSLTSTCDPDTLKMPSCCKPKDTNTFDFKERLIVHPLAQEAQKKKKNQRHHFDVVAKMFRFNNPTWIPTDRPTLPGNQAAGKASGATSLVKLDNSPWRLMKRMQLSTIRGMASAES